jgi:tetratricopeptide (TPR) repeat protein
MTRRVIFGLLGCLLVAGCGSHTDAPKAPQDQNLQRYQRAGQSAYGLGRPQEAIAQYRLALTQAEARDDLSAIGNLSFNLAAAQLQANQPADALATARQARAELARRGAPPLSALDLVEATALYRTGDAATADAMATGLQSDADRQIANAATFLRGLIADDRHDVSGLTTASDSLQQAATAAALASTPAPATTAEIANRAAQQADALELQARLARLKGDDAMALSTALQAADLRRVAIDYRGLARALSVAANAARHAQKPEAADLYLRAGRSAAAQNDKTSAEAWLKEALRLSHDAAVTEAAQKALADLAQPATN